MRALTKPLLFVFACILCFAVNAQDSLKLTCPFMNGTGREPKEAFSWDPPDRKVIMISQTDTVVRSAYEGKVSNVSQTEDGLYEVVIYYKDLYFWYYNVTKPLVRKMEVVKAGQAIGTYSAGNELEFRVFRDEVAIDSRNWLECKIIKD